jgi:phosphatidylinositol alpha-1,6-mannosyltransferase
MRQKRIIVFSEDFIPTSGGIAQWAAGVAKSIHQMGHDLRVVTRFRSSNHAENISKWSFPVYLMKGKHWKKLRSWYCYNTIKNLYKKGFFPDLIIATTWNFARGITSITKKNRTKLLLVVHGLEVTRKMSLIKRKWLIRTLMKCDLVIAVSNFTRSWILENYELDQKKILVFPNGVDISIFNSKMDSSPLKKTYQLSNEKIVLTLARVVERKGHDQVIKALPKVMKKFPNLKYIISGDWNHNYYLRLQKLIKELNLENVVIFTGYVSANEIQQFYNLCDVYIMPSREIEETGDTEGFGITYLEANACEKPVIGGNSGGVSDAVVDGVTGFLVNPMDTDEIAEKLLILLSDPQLSHQLGKQGRERIEKSYTWDRISENILEEIFQERN